MMLRFLCKSPAGARLLQRLMATKTRREKMLEHRIRLPKLPPLIMPPPDPKVLQARRAKTDNNNTKVGTNDGKNPPESENNEPKKQQASPQEERKPAPYRNSDALKLIEFNSRYSLLKPGMRVLEIGAAPGGWTQVLVRGVKSGEDVPTVVAVDTEMMERVVGARFVHGDIADQKLYSRIEKAIDYNKVDLVRDSANKRVGV